MDSNTENILTKVIFLQRVFKYVCRTPLEPVKLSTICLDWQDTLRDEFDTAAIIFKNVIEKERFVNGRFRQKDVPIPADHPIDLLFRKALRKNVAWIVRAVARAGLDLNQTRAAYGMTSPLWFSTVRAVSHSNDSVSNKKVNNNSNEVEDSILETLEALLSSGANIDYVAPNGTTSLFSAVSNASEAGSAVKVVSLFLQYNPSVRSKNKKGQTMMHRAIENNRSDLVELFIAHFLSKGSAGEDDLIFLLNEPDADGFTPLLFILNEMYVTFLTRRLHNQDGRTLTMPSEKATTKEELHVLAQMKCLEVLFENPRVAKLVDVEAREQKDNRIALCIALSLAGVGYDPLLIVTLLVEKGKAKTRYEEFQGHDNDRTTMIHKPSKLLEDFNSSASLSDESYEKLKQLLS